MSNIDSDPYELIRQAEQCDYGTAQRADLLDRAIVAADRSASVRSQFDARAARLHSATFGGEPDLALALFAWCQKTSDERPDLFNPTRLLWTYKHVTASLPSFSRIPQGRIDAIASDMGKRYAACGQSPRAVYTTRARVAWGQGKIALARELWNEAMRHPRDGYADCEACEVNCASVLLMLEERFPEAIDAAAPILSGAMRCGCVPHGTLPGVIFSLHAMQQHEEARALHARSYRLVRYNPLFLDDVATLIEVQVKEDNLAQAAQMATRHLPWLAATKEDSKRLHYIHALHRLLLAVGKAAQRASKWRQQLIDGLEQVYIPAPEDTAPPPAKRLERLSQQIAEEGLALVAGLDRRNGNDYFQRRWQAETYI